MSCCTTHVESGYYKGPCDRTAETPLVCMMCWQARPDVPEFKTRMTCMPCARTGHGYPLMGERELEGRLAFERVTHDPECPVRELYVIRYQNALETIKALRENRPPVYTPIPHEPTHEEYTDDKVRKALVPFTSRIVEVHVTELRGKQRCYEVFFADTLLLPDPLKTAISHLGYLGAWYVNGYSLRMGQNPPRARESFIPYTRVLTLSDPQR